MSQPDDLAPSERVIEPLSPEGALVELGLSARAAALYVQVILTDAPLRAPDDPSDAAAVAELLAQGLLSPAPAGHLSPSPPDLPLSALLEARVRQLHSIRAAVDELRLRYRPPADIGETLKTRTVLRVRLTQLAHLVQRELLCLVDVGAADSVAEALSALRPTVHVRVVTDRPAARSAAIAALSHVRLRVVDRIPTNVVIADQQRGIVLPRNGAQPAAGLLLSAPTGVQALVGLFEAVWTTAENPDVRRDSVTPTLSVHDRRLLGFVARGLTDDLIARQLNVARRTAQRRISALAARLGARGRVGLLRVAAEQGLLDYPDVGEP